ncbi:hypothetical protein GGS26DRAFT_285452 [Hypomontagnella submonticulosa]|nr:hypothetical protein GGS26DRAFT_285452 [Hypomontagnella submonticulosa]
MAMDTRDLSREGVSSLTRLLSRRPEYGIAIPSRRWLSRQEEKLKNMPSEILRSSNPLRRLVIKIADRIDPTLVDPRAVLCKVHEKLNPWLIRRLFLVVAYEVTVHTDALRTWGGRTNFTILSAFVGRVDAIAALWTEPELYRECYGTPPFENHMVYVRSGCEACILSALGANARVLADLRSILIDRIERRRPRPDGRRGKDPRLLRYIEGWIDHLGSDRGMQCRAMSESVLVELRARRPLLKQWRRQRRKERTSHAELKRTGSGHRLATVPKNASRGRRSRQGIPVAEVDLVGAEEQRRAAMFSMTEEGRSIFRPDSLSGHSQIGPPRMAPYDPTNEQLAAYENDPYGGDDDEDDDGYEEEPRDAGRDFQEEEWSRRKVTDWYTTRVEHSNLSADDAKSVLSMAHPAFLPDQYSHASAAPSPLDFKRDRDGRSTTGRSHAASDKWTDATVYTYDPNRSQTDVPPVPRVPSQYRNGASRVSSNSRRPSPPSRANSVPHSRPRTVASSVYSSDQRTPAGGSIVHSIPPRSPPQTPARRPANRFLVMGSDAGSSATTLPLHRASSSRVSRGYNPPLTPVTSSRGSVSSATSGVRNLGIDDRGTVHPNDSQSQFWRVQQQQQQVDDDDDAATGVTPWPSFARKKSGNR